MKIGILGSGVVAQTLASGFLKHGHAVTLGTREPDRLRDWAAQNPQARIAGVAAAAQFGELLVLAVKGSAAAAVLRSAGADNLAGKPVIDTNNPLADAPPVHGVLSYFTKANDSLMEQLQREFPQARLVKAFSSVGAARMVNPQYAGGRPTMFICGNDDAAKTTVSTLLDAFGWNVADMGKAIAARAIEPLAVLWCIPGFLQDQWTHAFALLT